MVQLAERGKSVKQKLLYIHVRFPRQREWSILRMLCLEGETTGARTSVPSYLCSLVSKLRPERRENTKAVARTWLGSFLPNSSAVIDNKNSPDVIHPAAHCEDQRYSG